MQEEEMHVIKRNGNSEIVSFDKILKRKKILEVKLNYRLIIHLLL